MDSIRVSINDTEVGYYKIEDTGVSFTWQAKLIDEINSFSTTTTKTITLPLTKELKVILKSPDSIDTTNSVSNREYFTINITWNGIVTVEGYIKLQKVVILENDEYIEFGIEPKEKDWITQFKDFKLTELDFTTGTSQQHTLTYANIITSETPLLATREYVYAPIDIAEVGRLQVLWVDKGSTNTYFYYLGEPVVAPSATFIANTYGFTETALVRYAQTMTAIADAFWNPRGINVAYFPNPAPIFAYYNQSGYMYVDANSYWEVSDFSPSVRHSAILRRCFERIGYGMTIIDSSSYFNNKYNFVHNIGQLNKLESDIENYTKYKVGTYAGGFLITGLAGGTFPGSTTVPIHTFVAPFINKNGYGYIDNSNYLDTNSTVLANVTAGTNVSKFTATESVIIKLKWDYSFNIKTVTGFLFNYGVKMKMLLYDSTNTLRRVCANTLLPISNTNWNRTPSNVTESGTVNSSYVYMDSGDYIKCVFEIYYLIGTAATTIDFYIHDNNTLESFMYEGGNFKNKTIRLNEYLPDLPAYDYIKDLSFINNWEFYTNEKLKQVYIVREDYKRTGKRIDFKNKLNISNGVELEEIGLQWPKKSYFNWKQDENDWCIKFIEQVTKASLGNTYEQSELEMACRFGVGVITNLNLFTADVQEFTNNIYSATLDKFDTSNRINFNTVEMKGDGTWPHLPTWKRIDYEPRYLTVYFSQTLETNGVNGVTGVVYSIEGNANHTTYPRVEFGEPLHYGDATGLLKTKYARRERAIKYGWIFRGKFNVDNIDVTEFVETYEDNNFRANYQLQLKGVSVIGELLKVADFSPNTSDQTEIEFVIYRDDL